MTVVFQMLTDFMLLWIFQPRFEFVQNRVQIELRNALHPFVRHRHVPARITRDRKGQADQAGFE